MPALASSVVSLVRGTRASHNLLVDFICAHPGMDMYRPGTSPGAVSVPAAWYSEELDVELCCSPITATFRSVIGVSAAPTTTTLCAG